MVLFFAAELTYVLWHRRRFRKKSAISEDIERSVVSSVMSNNESFFARTPPPPPKDLLLYNLCLNGQVPPGTAETTSPFTAPGTPIIPTFSAPAASVPQRLHSRQIVQTSYSSNDVKDRRKFDAKRDMIQDQIEEEVATFSSASSTSFHSSPFSSPPHPSTIITRPLTP